MDAATGVLAGYAAVVSTGSLSWQVYSWRLARKNRVEVTVSFALLGMTNGSTIDAVSVGLVNRSDHSVRVAGVGIDLQDGSGRQVHQVHEVPGATIPGSVAPHDSGSTYFEAAELARSGLDLYAPITGWVRLATGEIVKSKAKRIRSRG